MMINWSKLIKGISGALSHITVEVLVAVMVAETRRKQMIAKIIVTVMMVTVTMTTMKMKNEDEEQEEEEGRRRHHGDTKRPVCLWFVHGIAKIIWSSCKIWWCL